MQQHLITSVDRRLPAMLRGFELNQPRRDDVVAESIYTAAVWQTVTKVLADHRMLPDVYKVKAAYVVGIGIDTPDQPSLLVPSDLGARTDGGPVTSQLLCEPNEVLTSSYIRQAAILCGRREI